MIIIAVFWCFIVSHKFYVLYFPEKKKNEKSFSLNTRFYAKFSCGFYDRAWRLIKQYLYINKNEKFALIISSTLNFAKPKI